MLRRLGRLALLVSLSGCAGSAFSPGYYWQAATGQLELWRKAQPIDALLADPRQPDALRRKLELVKQIRHYASRELGLPDNDSYRYYVALDRPFVVWNVFAADPLSVKPRQWCFPVAGCVSYRGYFSEAAAMAYAESLRAQGLDVFVGGVPAYSTLGWFDDPVLSSFIRYPETELARLIFHELAHQVLYVSDDTEFNESFATAVEEEGIRRWLALPGKAGLRDEHARMQALRRDFSELVRTYRGELESLYASTLSIEAKRQGKAATLGALGQAYHKLKTERWDGFAGYDRWFAQDINNATLASVGLYSGLVPAFEDLLQACRHDLPCFFDRVRALAKRAHAARRMALSATPHR